MGEIFVSYAREDEPKARAIAEALCALGHRAWRDDELPAHRAYADVIEERLNSADAVIVLWSAEAAKSQWVRAEADSARNRGTLIQASLDGSIPPLPFNQVQCADLNVSDKLVDAPGWAKLMGSLEALAGPAAVAQGAAPRPRRSRVSVCVLPFQNMSGDSEQEYFSDGISEDITTDLSKVSALGVTARNTAFQFKGRSIDVCDVAGKLGVTHVLEGSVRKAGGRIRITAQLIDGASGEHVWADRYDRDLTDIFAIQDEISKAIVDALKVNLLPAEKKAIEQRGTSNADAYDYYLLARKYWITGNWGDTRQLELVVRVCQQALRLDPNYARAWGLLAIVQCIWHFTFSGPGDGGIAAAVQALSINPDIAEAYCVRARHFYERGDFAECDRELARALSLDPDAWEVNRETGRISYFQRRFDEAVAYFEKAVSIDETDFNSWSLLASAYDALGNAKDASRAAGMAGRHAEDVVANDPTNGAAVSALVFGLAASGERTRAKEWIERALLICPDNQIMRYNFACQTAVRLQDAEAAIDLLEPIFPDFSLSALKAFVADPDFDSLRDNPRFVRLMDQAKKRLSDSSPSPPAGASAPPRS